MRLLATLKHALRGPGVRASGPIPAAGPVWTGADGAAVFSVDAKGRLTAASPGAGALIGRDGESLPGSDFETLFAEKSRASAMQSLAAESGAPFSARLENGAEVDVVVARAGDGGRTALVLARPAQADDEAKLRAAADAAREEARRTADLVADLSHEMRTPLNAVIGFADALASETFGPLGDPKYAEYAGHIRSSGRHLLDLVSSILDLAKIEAERFTLQRSIVDVGALARECAAMIRLPVEAAGLKLVIRIAEDLPASSLDARAVRQILLNLLSNAVKFTSDGEITLSVEADGEELVLTVADTGVGMSEAELKQLGARFTAAHGEGVRGAKGAGLGLALAFALAELHGGSMKLQSAPGEGVRATVRLPVTAPPQPRRRLRAVDVDAEAPENAPAPAVLTQLERIEAWRRERASAA